jgi:hypothetical protein
MIIRPEDILPDGQDRAVIGSTSVRKGSVAAFLANARLLEEAEPGSAGEAAITAQLQALAEPLNAIGLFDVFAIRSPRVAAAAGL